MTRDSVFWASELTRLAGQRAAVSRERHEAIAAAARTDDAKPAVSFWSSPSPPEVLAADRLRQRAAFEEKVAECEERLARNQAEERRAREQLARASRNEDEAVYALEISNYARRRPLMGQGLAITEDDYKRALNSVPGWVVALFAGVVLALTVLRTRNSGSSTLDAVSQIVTIVLAVASLGVAIWGVRAQQRPLTLQLPSRTTGADNAGSAPASATATPDAPAQIELGDATLDAPAQAERVDTTPDVPAQGRLADPAPDAPARVHLVEPTPDAPAPARPADTPAAAQTEQGDG